MKSKLSLGFPVFLASVNMRAGLVLIGPLIPILKEYFGLSNTQLSLLAAIPLICFAGSSLIMGFVGKLGSSNRIITWALITLSIALIARAFTGEIGLFVFSFLMGISIAVMNYEIPAWIKEHAPNDSGFMTGIYVTIMGIFAAISIAITVPLAESSSLSWRMSMIPWIVVSILSALYWKIRIRSGGVVTVKKAPHFWQSQAFKNPIAWALVFFFGLESMAFYGTATWFPTLLTTKGFTLRDAAIAISISGLIGSGVSIAVPHYVEKLKDPRIAIVLVSAIMTLGFFMITVQEGQILLLWLTISNIGISIVFPIALLLYGAKYDSPEATRNLSTMVQSLAYVLSATGPLFMGVLHDRFNSWDAAMYGVVGLCILQLITGWIVGKPSKIPY
ncbi:MAG: CynX/NimT family MFS transporter [Candidatus Nanopelagicaceae bacterium]